MGLIQKKYLALSSEELEHLSKESEEESIKIALGIAAQPPIPIPEFELDPELKSADALSSFIDDFFESKKEKSFEEESGYDEIGQNQFGLKEDVGAYDDFIEKDSNTKYSESEENENSKSMSEEDKADECNNMKSKYNVVIGVSWGNLPYDLQDTWRLLRCDLYFS